MKFMNENLITKDNTFSRKELEEAFKLGWLSGDTYSLAEESFQKFVEDILQKRQEKYNKIMNAYSEHQLKNWWNNLLSPMQKENFIIEYFPDKKVEELSWDDIEYISSEEDAKLGF